MPPDQHPIARRGTDGGTPDLATKIDLQRYMDVVRRRWWLILLTGLVGGTATWWSQRDETPQYTAEVLLQQRPEVPVVPDGPARTGELTTDFGSQVEILRSRAVLGFAVDSLGLQFRLTAAHAGKRQDLLGSLRADADLDPGPYLLEAEGDTLTLFDEFAGAEVGRSTTRDSVVGPGFTLRIGAPEAVEFPVTFYMLSRGEAIQALQSRMRVQPGMGEDLIWVRYTSSDPELAADIANSIATAYLAYRTRTAREAVRRRREAIAAELVDLADSLRQVQDLVLEYQKRTGLLDPDVEGNALLSAQLQTENELRTLAFEEGLLETLTAGLAGETEGEAGQQRLLAMGSQLIREGADLNDRLQELQTERSRMTASSFGYTSENPDVQVVDSLIASTRDRMRIAAEQALSLHRARESSTRERLGALRQQVGQLPATSAAYARLQQRVDAVQRVFDGLTESYYEAQIAEGSEGGDVQVVDAATVPLWPDPTWGWPIIAFAAVAGVLVGTVGAAAIESLDTKIRGTRDAEMASGLDVIGTVPRIGRRGTNARQQMIGKEAFREIRTNLRFAPAEQPRLLAVTSAVPVEGKSTVASNLALTLAAQGSRTLLVDADLRRPSIHRVIRTDRSPGISDVLNGLAELSEVIRHVPGRPGFDVLPSGTAVENSAELVGGRAFRELLAHLAAEYDMVIIDTPPLLAVTDATVIATLVDGTMMVAHANRTDQEELAAAVDQLRNVNAPLVGLVLNGVPIGRHKYANYRLYYAEKENGATPGENTKGRGRGGRSLLGGSRHAGGAAGTTKFASDGSGEEQHSGAPRSEKAADSSRAPKGADTTVSYSMFPRKRKHR